MRSNNSSGCLTAFVSSFSRIMLLMVWIARPALMNATFSTFILPCLASCSCRVSSMLAMGLSLTMAQILQPLKNVRLVVLALLANFVLVPLLAYLLTLIIPLEQSLRIGLIVLSTAGRLSCRSCPSSCKAPRATSRSASG